MARAGVHGRLGGGERQVGDERQGLRSEGKALKVGVEGVCCHVTELGFRLHISAHEDAESMTYKIVLGS